MHWRNNHLLILLRNRSDTKSPFAFVRYGPPTTIYNRFVRWARRGVWEKLFRELAGNGRSTDTQMINSTHVKAHRSAAGGKGGTEAGCWPLARRAQHEDTRTRRC